MRKYKVGNLLHKVYESIEEVPSNISIIDDWRNSKIGDWVKTDDECYIQILRRGTMLRKNSKRDYIGTCTGTFLVLKKTKMDADRRVNIYSFGGYDTPDMVLANRKKLTASEELFVQFISAGMSPEDAYVKAYPTNNKRYARTKAVNLIKTERVKTAMREELKPILDELGISEESILSNINNIALTSEKDETRLKALFKLSDIMDLEDKNAPKVQQLTGIQFQGISDGDLKEAQRPIEIENEK